MDMDLTEYLENNGIKELSEGHCQQSRGHIEFLKKMVSSNKIVDVLEIGFNVGHSAEIFLKTNPNVKVTSFDLGKYSYTQMGKSFIDMKYPFRHQLVLGDSNHTVLEYMQIFPNKKFDLIFIDGGNQRNTVLKDITNCKEFAHKDTIIIVNNIVYIPEWVRDWTIGPSHVWAELTQSDFIATTGYEEYDVARGLAWGKYNNITSVRKANKTFKNYNK